MHLSVLNTSVARVEHWGLLGHARCWQSSVGSAWEADLLRCIDVLFIGRVGHVVLAFSIFVLFLHVKL